MHMIRLTLASLWLIAAGVSYAHAASAEVRDKLLCTTPQAAMAAVWLSYKNAADEYIAAWVGKRWPGETCVRKNGAASFMQTLDAYTRFNPAQGRIIVTWFVIRAWTFADGAFVWHEAIPWYDKSDFIRPSQHILGRPE